MASWCAMGFFFMKKVVAMCGAADAARSASLPTRGSTPASDEPTSGHPALWRRPSPSSLDNGWTAAVMGFARLLVSSFQVESAGFARLGLERIEGLKRGSHFLGRADVPVLPSLGHPAHS